MREKGLHASIIAVLARSGKTAAAERFRAKFEEQGGRRKPGEAEAVVVEVAAKEGLHWQGGIDKIPAVPMMAVEVADTG